MPPHGRFTRSKGMEVQGEEGNTELIIAGDRVGKSPCNEEASGVTYDPSLQQLQQMAEPKTLIMRPSVS
ncbi:hypothetical protein EmuJ_000214400 [Echinococcus multilocularis]|uniref:Uncharacterized protein n=1 Tax=Echinococcus multilocularis TaxID=6211 RepID=A0A087W1B8_ECHMU|nr:hypothetical protein EmuJ_000214400 [Echinococcus multilocularis]